MIPRHLSRTLKASARDFSVVTVTGPRQSGKTTLVHAAFPWHRYASLEDPAVRAFASGQTIASDFFDGIHYCQHLAGRSNGVAGLVHGGDASYKRRGVSVLPWSDWA